MGYYKEAWDFDKRKYGKRKTIEKSVELWKIGNIIPFYEDKLIIPGQTIEIYRKETYMDKFKKILTEVVKIGGWIIVALQELIKLI